MASQQFKNQLREAVRELKAAYYSNDGDAFCHWALRTYLELDDDEAFEACDVGGPGDRGLDAYWHDEEQRRIILAQAKYSQRKGKVGAEPVIEMERAYKWLLRLANGGSRKIRKELRAAARKLAACRSEDADYPVELLCFASRNFSAAAHEHAAAINEDLWLEGVTLKLVGVDLLEEAVKEQRSRLDEPPNRIHLDLESHFVFEPENAPKTVVASVNVRELAEIEQQYHYRIFQRNVRYFLKARNRVNHGIETTLSSPDGRRRFWYYNNGIAIVCDRIEVKESKRAKDPSAKAVVKNLQIVNGCQTTTTLGELADRLEAESNSPAYVLVRFIESSDPELQTEISRFNNRQNAVKDRDLLSNDDPQERLEKEFAEFDLPWFYERKRGQWDAEVKPQAAKRRRYGDRKIDNEAAAQAAYAFWRDPGVARARKRMLFVRKAEDPSGLYDQIFTESTPPERLLLPFLVQQYVGRRKRAYMKELKAALEIDNPSVKEKRTTSRQWLKFADQMIVGAIRLYWEQHIDLTRIVEQRAILGEDSFELAVAAAYELSIRDLSPFFRAKVADGEKRDEPFDAANYVKANWSEVRGWIEDQLEYADNWEAFSEIPAFEG
jgi:hypothetical protein